MSTLCTVTDGDYDLEGEQEEEEEDDEDDSEKEFSSPSAQKQDSRLSSLLMQEKTLTEKHFEQFRSIIGKVPR